VVVKGEPAWHTARGASEAAGGYCGRPLTQLNFRDPGAGAPDGPQPVVVVPLGGHVRAAEHYLAAGTYAARVQALPPRLAHLPTATFWEPADAICALPAFYRRT